MGVFDDIIPKKNGKEASGGVFDDIIPSKVAAKAKSAIPNRTMASHKPAKPQLPASKPVASHKPTKLSPKYRKIEPSDAEMERSRTATVGEAVQQRNPGYQQTTPEDMLNAAKEFSVGVYSGGSRGLAELVETLDWLVDGNSAESPTFTNPATGKPVSMKIADLGKIADYLRTAPDKAAKEHGTEALLEASRRSVPGRIGEFIGENAPYAAPGYAADVLSVKAVQALSKIPKFGKYAGVIAGVLEAATKKDAPTKVRALAAAIRGGLGNAAFEGILTADEDLSALDRTKRVGGALGIGAGFGLGFEGVAQGLGRLRSTERTLSSIHDAQVQAFGQADDDVVAALNKARAEIQQGGMTDEVALAADKARRQAMRQAQSDAVDTTPVVEESLTAPESASPPQVLNALNEGLGNTPEPAPSIIKLPDRTYDISEIFDAANELGYKITTGDFDAIDRLIPRKGLTFGDIELIKRRLQEKETSLTAPEPTVKESSAVPETELATGQGLDFWSDTSAREPKTLNEQWRQLKEREDSIMSVLGGPADKLPQGDDLLRTLTELDTIRAQREHVESVGDDYARSRALSETMQSRQSIKNDLDRAFGKGRQTYNREFLVDKKTGRPKGQSLVVFDRDQVYDALNEIASEPWGYGQPPSDPVEFRSWLGDIMSGNKETRFARKSPAGNEFRSFGEVSDELTSYEVNWLKRDLMSRYKSALSGRKEPSPADLSNIGVDAGDKLTPYDTPAVVRARAEQEMISETYLIDTPEREQMRDQITEELYDISDVDQSKQAYIVIGPPAAGKSSVLAKPLAKETRSLLVDSDLAKDKIPEFEGGKNAGAVHEESDMIRNTVINRAVLNGDNVVLPIVGRSLDSIRELRDIFNAYGYDVHLKLLDLPADKATRNAVLRFYKDGRFVDPDYVLNKVSDKPKQNYGIMKSEGGFKSYEHFSNDVPKGTKPQLVESIAPDTVNDRGAIRGQRAESDRIAPQGLGEAEGPVEAAAPSSSPPTTFKNTPAGKQGLLLANEETPHLTSERAPDLTSPQPTPPTAQPGMLDGDAPQVTADATTQPNRTLSPVMRDLADQIIKLEEEAVPEGTHPESFERSRTSLIFQRAMRALTPELDITNDHTLGLERVRQVLAKEGFTGNAPIRELVDARKAELSTSTPSTPTPDVPKPGAGIDTSASAPTTFVKQMRDPMGDPISIPHVVKNPTPELPKGHNVLQSEIVLTGGKDKTAYRISVVDNGNGGRYINIEKELDVLGTMERVDVRFDRLTDSEIERNSWLSKKSADVFKKFTEGEGQGSLLDASPESPIKQSLTTEPSAPKPPVGSGAMPRAETYWQGDRAEYTGNTDGQLHELEIMEGHRKGEKVYTSRRPDGSNPNAERAQSEWQKQQADFRKLKPTAGRRVVRPGYTEKIEVARQNLKDAFDAKGLSPKAKADAIEAAKIELDTIITEAHTGKPSAPPAKPPVEPPTATGAGVPEPGGIPDDVAASLNRIKAKFKQAIDVAGRKEGKLNIDPEFDKQFYDDVKTVGKYAYDQMKAKTGAAVDDVIAWARELETMLGEHFEQARPHLSKMWEDIRRDKPTPKVGGLAGDASLGVSAERIGTARSAQGLPPVELPEFRGKDASYETGKQWVDSGGDIDGLVDDVLSNNRKLDADDIGAIKYRFDQIEQALDSATPEDAAKLAGLRDKAQQAVRIGGGREWAEMGHALQLKSIADPNNVGDILQGALEVKRLKTGDAKAELSPDEAKSVIDANNRVKELEAQLEETKTAATQRIEDEVQRRVKDLIGRERAKPEFSKRFTTSERARLDELKRFIVSDRPNVGIPVDKMAAAAEYAGIHMKALGRYSYEYAREILREVLPNASEEELVNVYRQAVKREDVNAKRVSAGEKRAQAEIDKIRRQVTAEIRKQKTPPVDPSEKLTGLKEELEQVRGEYREKFPTEKKPTPPRTGPKVNAQLKGRVNSLNREAADLRAGNPPKPKIVEGWDAETIRLREDLQRARQERATLVTGGQKLDALDVAIIAAKGNMGWLTGYDNSILGRQGWNMIFKDPKTWVEAVKGSHKALVSEGQAQLMQDAIQQHPVFPKAQQSKLFFSTLDDLGKVEENVEYLRSLGKFGSIVKKATRPFERAFTVGGNILRHDNFYRQADAVASSGRTWSLDESSRWADMLNKLNGRGNLGPLEPAAKYANAAVISIRKAIGDVQWPALARFALSKDPGKRAVGRAVFGTMVKQTIAIVTLAQLINRSFDEEIVSLDPDAKNFLQFRYGNTRFDLVPGSHKAVTRGLWTAFKAIAYQSRWADSLPKDRKPSIYNREVSGIALDYLTRGVNPGIVFAGEMVTGKDYRGKPITPGESAANMVVPWNVQDVIDAWQEEGPWMAMPVAAYTFYGGGARTYKDEPPKSRPGSTRGLLPRGMGRPQSPASQIRRDILGN